MVRIPALDHGALQTISTEAPRPSELRQRAVRMVAEVRSNYETESAAMGAVAEKLGIWSRETMRN
ncbi:hypothetical protein GCM10010468_43900 [Actinocorallia longicatena]|uniref:Transposase n=1 Tax=Actinocorallia longicatena TaxID=111803 RepID=A0ABP6QDH4_9ACTN